MLFIYTYSIPFYLIPYLLEFENGIITVTKHNINMVKISRKLKMEMS